MGITDPLEFKTFTNLTIELLFKVLALLAFARTKSHLNALICHYICGINCFVCETKTNFAFFELLKRHILVPIMLL